MTINKIRVLLYLQIDAELARSGGHCKHYEGAIDTYEYVGDRVIHTAYGHRYRATRNLEF